MERINTFHCVEEETNDQKGPLVVDENWHALCQAIFPGKKVRHGESCFRDLAEWKE